MASLSTSLNFESNPGSSKTLPTPCLNHKKNGKNLLALALSLAKNIKILTGSLHLQVIIEVGVVNKTELDCTLMIIHLS